MLEGDSLQSRRVVLEGVASGRPLLFESCITKNELARRLQVSVSFINKLMAEEGLPHLKVGRVVRFQVNVVFAWFRTKGRKP